MSEPEWKRQQLSHKAAGQASMDRRVRDANTPAKKAAAVVKFVTTGKKK